MAYDAVTIADFCPDTCPGQTYKILAHRRGDACSLLLRFIEYYYRSSSYHKRLQHQLLVMDLFEKITKGGLFSHQLQCRIHESLGILADAFKQFGLPHLAFSFNGGKDSIVLLHLLRAGIAHFLFTSGEPAPEPMEELAHIVSAFFDGGDNFPEMSSFISATNQRYHIHLTVETSCIKEGLSLLLEEKPALKGIFQGVRRTDPYSASLKHFQKTDAGWPEIVRISPILDWCYADVWEFLRTLNLEVCSLYQEGYTSIGSRFNTVPNPALLQPDGSYLPAWELADGEKERDCRKSSS